MSSLHVNLTLGHQTSMPHMSTALDPQMRVFYQRNLDPFASSLSTTDLLRAAGNLLGLVRSSLSWAGQFFSRQELPKPGSAQPKSGKENEGEEKKEKEEGAKRPDPRPTPVSETEPQTPPLPTQGSVDEERVRQTREKSRRTTAEAQERIRTVRKNEPAEKPAAFADLPRHYGIRLALELSLGRSRRSKDLGKEGERPSQGETRPGAAARAALPGVVFRGSLSLHLPLARPSASGRGGREGR
ncbi:hypothetical protein [Methylacidimicrobium tartarophylax]|uniref:Uncharacterized protein n=1 Tax=Methylacidimicrobium tartarophylax TaxID=1041768 RepID=A0A5E6M8S6_9BACT|nr:hypothetical protein [Methylacidimicrobium tartarophylax]VVM05607.1 hypothetical protein MAMT_00690 [Methylacidimicrobium tartarophylax]